MAEQDARRLQDAPHRSPPLAASGSTAPAVPHTPAVEYEVDLLLTAHEAKLVEKFRQDIRLCETDTERFDKCLQKRDELLEENDRLVLRLAAFDHVMSTECPTYRGRRERTRPRSSQPRITHEDGAAKWDRFVGVAANGFDTIRKLLPPLQAISLHWGKDFVQHYHLANKGQHYCNTFSAAVKDHTRDNGVRKLNQLLLRRFQIPGRRALKEGVNPIEPVDLQNLARWRDEGPFVKEGDPDKVHLQFVDLACKDLPPNFAFDQFGLMVRCPPMPLAGSVLEGISDTTSTKKEASIPPAAANMSIGDADSVTAPTAVTTPASSNSELSTPFSFPLDSPPDDSFNAIVTRLRSTAKSYNDAASRYAASAAATTRLRPRTENPDYHEARPRTSKPASRQSRSLNTASLQQERCCPPEIPPAFLATLDKLDTRTVKRMLSAYAPLKLPFQKMCLAHLQGFTEVVTKEELSGDLRSLNADTASEAIGFHRSPSLRRRRASLPDLADDNPLKRVRLGDVIHSSVSSAPRRERPLGYDPIRDEAYRRQVLVGLQSIEHAPNSWGRRTDELVFNILQESKPPTAEEAYFLCGEKAAQQLESGRLDMPVFTQDEQQFRWKGEDCPIRQFFRRMEDLGLDRTVSVQIPSRTLPEGSCERKTLQEVRDRFLRQRPASDPWNLLDLQSPFPSALPSFLEGENCQLLLRVRDAVLMGNSAERVAAAGQDWNMWRNVTDWALLSEGGNTAPHTDSHGFSTRITVRKGRIGFGWMSNPSQRQKQAWISDPHTYTDGEWRHVVLSPGQTVFFPSGTVHFVFRAQGEQTFALGGHILQWSSIDQWLEVIVSQVNNPEITNEDMELDVSKYVEIVKGLVENRIRAGRAEELGGQEVIGRFFSLLEVSRLALSGESELTTTRNFRRPWGTWQTELSSRRWMDGWILFRPEALSLKGLGTLTTYDSSASPKVSHKPSTLPLSSRHLLPLALIASRSSWRLRSPSVQRPIFSS
jgi:hypothetical protein